MWLLVYALCSCCVSVPAPLHIHVLLDAMICQLHQHTSPWPFTRPGRCRPAVVGSGVGAPHRTWAQAFLPMGWRAVDGLRKTRKTPSQHPDEMQDAPAEFWTHANVAMPFGKFRPLFSIVRFVCSVSFQPSPCSLPNRPLRLTAGQAELSARSAGRGFEATAAVCWSRRWSLTLPSALHY